MQTEKISQKLIAVALVGIMLFAYNAFSGETSKVDGCLTPPTVVEMCTLDATAVITSDITYKWDIEKEVDKSTVTLNKGEKTELKYKLTATREIASVNKTGVFNVSIIVDNKVDTKTTDYKNNPTKGLKVRATFYSVLNGQKEEIKSILLSKEDSPLSNELNTDEYAKFLGTVSFTPVEGAKYEVHVRATVDNFDEKNPYGFVQEGYVKTGCVKVCEKNKNYIDESATIVDDMTVPTGFSVSDREGFPWKINDSGTKEYTVILTNDSVITGGSHDLKNVATLLPDDGGKSCTDNAKVVITTEQEGITLSGCVTAVSYWNKKTSYDWKIEKTVDPSSWTFELGDAKTFNYTLTATRKLTTACSEEKGLTGSITVKNDGSEATKDLKINVQLQAKEGSEFKNVAEAVQELTPAQIAAGKSQQYAYEFKQNLVAGTEYRVVANITTTNYAGSEGTANGINKESAKFFLPAKPNETKEDCEATVEDDIIDVDGFKIESALDASDGIWTIKEEDLDKSGDLEKATKTYNVKITNENAEGGKEFTLKNEAALTEKDSKSLRTAQAQVLLKTKLKGITLDASLTTKGFWNKGISYDWKIEKKANPDYLRYKSKTSKEVQYTLTATRELDDTDEEHGIKGTIKVENKGDVPTENLEINVQVRYNKGDGYKDISSATKKIKPSKQIKEGEAEEYDYSIDFDPIKNAEYQVVATVTVTNYTHHLGDDYGIDEKEDVSFPNSPDEDVIDETAVVEDVFDVPKGFILSGEMDDEWEIKEKDLKKSGNKWTAEKTYTITLKNSSARYNNSYKLVNTATLKEEDTGRKSEAEEVVSILVKRTSSGGNNPPEPVDPPVEPTPVTPPAPPAPPAPTPEPVPEPIIPPAEPEPQLPNTGGETGLFISLGMSLVAYGSWLRFK